MVTIRCRLGARALQCAGLRRTSRLSSINEGTETTSHRPHIHAIPRTESPTHRDVRYPTQGLHIYGTGVFPFGSVGNAKSVNRVTVKPYVHSKVGESAMRTVDESRIISKRQREQFKPDRIRGKDGHVSDLQSWKPEGTQARNMVEDDTMPNQSFARRCGITSAHGADVSNVLAWTGAKVTAFPTRGSSHRPLCSMVGRSITQVRQKSDSLPERKHVYVALGSNVGDRIGAIESACNMIDGLESMRIVETSPLYETEPMYVEDQERFLNGVCKIETTLKPMELLDQLQAIENGLGRVKLLDKGPRNIDLDIVTYENETVQTERLIVPHKLFREREFVLRPLCDTSGKDYKHPESGKSAAAYLSMLPPAAAPMYPLTPLASGLEIRSLDPRRHTHIMSILNLTPDSFSDGGDHQLAHPSALKSTILSHISAGATIIDVGGQSSRPNAASISASEELSRILPAISLIKSLPEAAHVAISIDTYRAEVAARAIEAGAHMINDISAGQLDDEMLPTVARLGCTYIMMHMRGDPSTMQSSPHTTYPAGLVVETIRDELLARLAAAQAAGIRRWRIILDPGLGFAKTTEHNLEIVRRFGELRDASELRTYPWVVGSSRKKFVGEITGVKEARERGWGTGVTVAAAVQGGAEIVRVHDVEEMRQVVRMAEAIYRDGREGIGSG